MCLAMDTPYLMDMSYVRIPLHISNGQAALLGTTTKKKINKNKKNPTSSVISRESSEMLTVLFTISSALTKLPPQPPPIRNEISLPTIRKHGEVRVPCAMSP